MNRWPFTLFRHSKAPGNGARREYDRAELQHELGAPSNRGGVKEALPLICPATFRDDYRKNDNVERVSLLGLDIDEPQTDPSDCIDRLSRALGGVEVFACSTFSSEPGKYRLRALVPYDRPATAAEHRASWSAVAWLLREDAGIVVDRSCSDPSRGFFIWAIPPNNTYWSTHIDGNEWPVSLAARIEEEQRASERRAREQAARTSVANVPTQMKMTRARAYLAKCEPAIQGSGGSRATFVAAARLVHWLELSGDDALALMMTEYNPRCVPPWTESDLRRKVQEAAAKARDFETGKALHAPRRRS